MDDDMEQGSQALVCLIDLQSTAQHEWYKRADSHEAQRQSVPRQVSLAKHSSSHKVGS